MQAMKRKLMAAVSMLLVSGVMLTSASFAWFTISTAPEISNIKTSVAANGNLEIALAETADAPPASTTTDSGKNGTWGNLVDLNGYFSSAAIKLKPVQVADNGKVSIPTFGLDGRISSLPEVTGVAVETANLKGIYTYTSDGTIWAVRVDFWVRSNVAGTVSLSDIAARGTGETGLGSTLDNDKVTVAFLPQGGMIKKATLAGDKLTCADIVTLTANTPHKLRMYVYLDGTNITNADMANADAAVNLTVQFSHGQTLVNSMGVTGTGNARVTSTPNP